MKRLLACAAMTLGFALAAACGSHASSQATTSDGGGSGNNLPSSDSGGGNPGSNGDGGATNPGDDGGNPATSDGGGTPVTDGGDAGTGDCGCAAGFSCAAGSTICKSPDGVPAFGNVYLILEENHSYGTVLDGGPYIASLAASNTSASNYMDTLVHPSTPNYIALTSGSTQGITCDCQAGGGGGGTCPASCNSIEGASCNCVQPSTVANIADRIEAKGLTWHAYGESMNSPGCDTTNHDMYVARHVPFVYYESIQSNATRCANVVPWTASSFASDLGTYSYSFIAPNLEDDGHTEYDNVNEVTATDEWLSANVPTILAAASFKKNGVLFITWDEGDDTDNGLGPTDDHVLLLVISPFAKGGVTAKAYNHYSLLGTIESGLGLATPHLGAAPINDVWK